MKRGGGGEVVSILFKEVVYSGFCGGLVGNAGLQRWCLSLKGLDCKVVGAESDHDKTSKEETIK